MKEQLSLFDIELPKEIPEKMPVVKADAPKETPALLMQWLRFRDKIKFVGEWQ